MPLAMRMCAALCLLGQKPLSKDNSNIQLLLMLIQLQHLYPLVEESSWRGPTSASKRKRSLTKSQCLCPGLLNRHACQAAISPQSAELIKKIARLPLMIASGHHRFDLSAMRQSLCHAYLASARIQVAITDLLLVGSRAQATKRPYQTGAQVEVAHLAR